MDAIRFRFLVDELDLRIAKLFGGDANGAFREKAEVSRATLNRARLPSARPIFDHDRRRLAAETVTLPYAKMIATAANASLEELGYFVYPVGFGVPTDIRPEELVDALRRATEVDLAAAPLTTDLVDAADDLLGYLKAPSACPSSYLFALDRWATLLDHAAELSTDAEEKIKLWTQITDTIGKLETSPPPTVAENHRLLWCLYQGSIAHRQLRQFDRADALLETISSSSFAQPEQLESAAFQRIVVEFERSSEPPETSRIEEVDRIARDSWNGTHREGFALDLMGRMHERRGDLDASLECFLDALEIFARHSLGRCALATRARIRGLAGA